MAKKRIVRVILSVSVIAALTFTVACSDDSPGESSDNFDRQVMLENWADGFIIPGYEAYTSSLASLNSSASTFTNDPSLTNLENLRTAWLNANLDWQAVGMFEIGKAEEITLINFTNIYPTNTEDMIGSIEAEDYDLTSINAQDEQGFPAIEYLIYGVRETDQEIVELFAQEAYQNYLSDLVNRLESLAQTVLSDWNDGYRETFISNDGSDATSSVNMLVNDYIFYYEKHLRAGKIGIPAGVFTGSTAAEKVEGLYSSTSKTLFMEGLDAMQNFFNGGNGESLSSYLDFLNTITEGEDLAEVIDAQFELARTQANVLPTNFSDQVNDDNSVMLQTYDELQKNVINLKVDMLQALNIRVDFVDADGD